MTTTLKLKPNEIADLRATLNEEQFDFRRLDHAHFQARKPGLVISAYRSGKVVFQGQHAVEFLEGHGYDIPETDRKPGASGTSKTPTLDARVVGSDESGKGDYFGPLVVAAVAAGPDDVAALLDAGVKDCKQMSDATVLKAAAAIRKLCPHSIQRLMPPEYNAAHEKEGNVALFMSRMHAEAIAEIAEGCERAIIDQFTFAERLEAALKKAGADLPVEIRPKAEDNLAVAAASVLARAEFLLGLKELGADHGHELPKGAGAPVDRAGREIFQTGGIEELRQIAKVHFKTTRKISERLF